MSAIVYYKRVYHKANGSHLANVPYYFVYVNGAATVFETTNELDAINHAYANRANLVSPTIDPDPLTTTYVAKITVTDHVSCGTDKIVPVRYHVEYYNDWYYITNGDTKDKTYRLYYVDIDTLEDDDADSYPDDYEDADVHEITEEDVTDIHNEAEDVMKSSTKFLVEMPDDTETTLEGDGWDDIDKKHDVGFYRPYLNVSSIYATQCAIENAQNAYQSSQDTTSKQGLCTGTVFVISTVVLLLGVVTFLGLM